MHGQESAASDKGQPPIYDIRSLEDPFYGCNLLVKVTFPGLTRPILAIIDSAAQISMVREGLLDGLYKCTEYVNINTVKENAKMKCKLFTNVLFNIEDQEFFHTFASGPITDECILGLDFLLCCDAIVDLPMNTLVLRGRSVDVYVQRNGSGEDYLLSRVAVAKDTVIAAKTRQLVEVKFSHPEHVSYVTSPRTTDELLIGSFILDGSCNAVIEVANDSNQDVTLRRDEHLTNAVEMKDIVCSFGKDVTPRGDAGLPTSHVKTNTVRQTNLSSELPDWRTVGEINATDPPVCSTLIPPTDLSGKALQDLHVSACEEVPEHLRPMLEGAAPRLSIREQVALARLLTIYADTFSRNKTDLGIFSLLTHRIRTYNEEPVRERLRRTPLKFQKEEEKTLNDMLAAGVIEPSFSEWASAPVLVRKKDGEVRYTVDFRQVNVKSVKDAYPLPLITECTDMLAGNLWFHTLDLASGYWQIAIHPEDRHKTAFLTKYGLFQHVRMAQGLCNAPATFQRVMHLVLRGLTWNKALVYLDDIIVLGKSFSESLENLEVVLQRIRAHNLKLKPKKCQLFNTEVQFLGRTVSRDGVAITNDHVECIMKWPRPKDHHEAEKFLGFVNYHRDFLPGLAELLNPLYTLTKRGTTFAWTDSCEEAFQQLKQMLSSTPVLAYPNNDDPYILDTDASDFAVAAALYQVQQGQERPISFASFALTPAQKKYCTTRKELLAVVVFTRRFRHYLLGRHFKVRTDHGSLTWLCKFKNPCGQLGRWMEELSQYDMELEHRPGAKHINADSLSRIPEEGSCPNYKPGCELASLPCGGCSYCAKLHRQWSRFETDVDFVSPLLIRSASLKASEVFSQGYACVPPFPPSVRTNQLLVRQLARCPDAGFHDAHDSDVSDVEEPDLMSMDPEQSFIGTYTNQELRSLQMDDPELLPLFKWIEEEEPSPQELFALGLTTKTIWRHKHQLRIINGVLFYMWCEASGPQRRFIVPLGEREEVIRLCHDTRTGGHWGRDKTIQAVTKFCYWPNLKRDVELYVATCATCSRYKNKPKARAPLQGYQAGYPGERIHLDFMGPFPTSSLGNKYIISIVDQFTKWIEICALQDQTAELTAKTLVERWIVRFGTPRVIHTDQGRNFESHLFGELCHHLEIHKTRTTPYRPSSNGQVERYNQQIGSFIRCFLSGKTDTWDQYIDLLGMSLRASVSRATGFTPNMMFLGREVAMPTEVLFGMGYDQQSSPPEYVKKLLTNMAQTFSAAREQMKTLQVRGRQWYDERNSTKNYEYQVGDLVMVLNSASKVGHCKKLQPVWNGPYVVAHALSPVLYRVAEKRRTKTQHVDRMRIYLDRTVPMWVQRKRASLVATEQDEKSDSTEPEDEDLGEVLEALFATPEPCPSSSAPQVPRNDHFAGDSQQQPSRRTQTGRSVRPPRRFQDYHTYT